MKTSDDHNYQTVYCSSDHQSVASPTAGLHFSPSLLQSLTDHDHHQQYLRLHVGAGTFLPVKANNIVDHHMHSECYRINSDVLTNIINARKNNRSVVCVGTTTLRALESLGKLSGYNINRAYDFCDRWLTTDLFIFPNHKKSVSLTWLSTDLITNFHSPKSTLIMMIAALMGYKNQRALYQYVISNHYRMLSYGDGCLIPTISRI